MKPKKAPMFEELKYSLISSSPEFDEKLPAAFLSKEKAALVNGVLLRLECCIGALSGEGGEGSFRTRLRQLEEVNRGAVAAPVNEMDSDVILKSELDSERVHIDNFKQFMTSNYSAPCDLFELSSHLMSIRLFYECLCHADIPLPTIMQIDLAMTKAVCQADFTIVASMYMAPDYERKKKAGRSKKDRAEKYFREYRDIYIRWLNRNRPSGTLAAFTKYSLAGKWLSDCQQEIEARGLDGISVRQAVIYMEKHHAEAGTPCPWMNRKT